MGLRYQKRVSLGKGKGLNLSKSGVSYSQRTKYGSFGTRGFSIRTGIPGLTFRQNWGKGKNGLVTWLIVGVIVLAILVIYNLARLIGFIGVYSYGQLKKVRKNRKLKA